MKTFFKTKGLKTASLIMALSMMATGFTACGNDDSSKSSGDSTKAASTTKSSDSSGTSETKEKLKITISHQPYSHGLPSFIADKEGLFDAAGLDANIIMFTSGPAQNEALGANEWQVGAMGTPPSITGGLAYDSKIIAVSVDDTVSVDYWVRPDSDIAQITGAVEGHPDIMGNADTWRGKTILCPTATSAHFMLIATLSKLGLTQDDVSIIHMDVASAYTAFKSGQGDIVALWDPQSYQAEDEDWIKVSSGEATGETMPTVIVASQKAIDENYDAVLAWLKVYFEVCDKYRDDIAKQSEYLLEMQLDNGIDTTAELATRFCEDRPLPSLAQNVELFKGEEGSREIDTVIDKIIDFFVDQGSIDENAKQTLHDNGFVDSRFIDALASQA